MGNRTTWMSTRMLLAAMITVAAVAAGGTRLAAQGSKVISAPTGVPDTPPFLQVGTCLHINGILPDPTGSTNIRVRDVWGTWIKGVNGDGTFGDTWFNLDRATIVQVFPSDQCPK